MAIDLDCANCKTDEHVRRVPDETLTGTRRRLRCTECGYEWVRGEVAPKKIPLPTLEDIKKRFPGSHDVAPAKLARTKELKTAFLEREPNPEPNVAPYWSKYLKHARDLNINVEVHQAGGDCLDVLDVCHAQLVDLALVSDPSEGARVLQGELRVVGQVLLGQRGDLASTTHCAVEVRQNVSKATR